MYLRPFMMAVEVGLGVRPSAEYLYCLIASPAGAVLPGRRQARRRLAERRTTRARRSVAPARPSAAATTRRRCCPQAQGAEQGCAQVVCLDAVEHRWIDEMGSNNLFFVYGSGEHVEVVTPSLTGSSCPGSPATRCWCWPRSWAATATERRISAGRVGEGPRTGELTEVFGCGTAAVVTPVGRVRHHGGEVVIGDGQPGPVGLRLRAMLTDIQRGTAPDTHSWMRTLVPA